MSRRLLLFWSFLLALSLPFSSYAKITVRDPHQLKTLIQQNNLSLKQAQQLTEQAKASLANTWGKAAEPFLSVTSEFQDNQQQPISPFQSARFQDFLTNIDISQGTPYGLSFNVGVTHQWSKYFQAEPVNPQLPFPQSFHMPQTYLKTSLDLSQDFLGYTTRKTIENARIDLKNAKLSQQLVKDELYKTALALFWDTLHTSQLLYLNHQIKTDLVKMADDLELQVFRSVVENSELYAVQSQLSLTLAEREQLLLARQLLIENLALLLNQNPSELDLQPRQNWWASWSNVKSCEVKVEAEEFDPGFSSETLIAQGKLKQGTNQGKMTAARSWPNVKLSGSVAATGTDVQFSPGWSELGAWDRPIYQTGLEFSWPLSPSRSKASRTAARAAKRLAQLQLEQTLNEKQSLWRQLKKTVSRNKNESYHVEQAHKKKQKQLLELNRQYEQGRLSLFQWLQERIQTHQTQIQRQVSLQKRYAQLLDGLKGFDRFNCSLTGGSRD